MLAERIKQNIQAQGALTFERYMELALYDPAAGYYCNTLPKIGPAGDFITAPELSPLFSQCVGEAILDAQLPPQYDILEMGAGRGTLAITLWKHLKQSTKIPNRYYILEISPYLKKVQREHIETQCPELLEHISWVDTFPEQFTGVMLANEVFDAMPVHRFCIEGERIFEYFVNYSGDHFVWEKHPPSSQNVLAAIQALQKRYALHQLQNYSSEINLHILSWIQRISHALKQGLILIFDYGFPGHEYYHPQRHMGTLMCHTQHHNHPDPLILIGEQDITAHVDFTALAEAALSEHLEIAGYTHQAGFLMGSGITRLLDALPTDSPERIFANQQAKKLLQPHEMGELFKVMALTRELELPLKPFQFQDLRTRL